MNNFQNSNYPQNIPEANNSAPEKHAPSGGELFVGLNILSKIGIVFIIIGVIAFTATSEEYMPGIARTIMVFVLGAIMAGAGELFYRTGSAVFARALTVGAILDWTVAVLGSYYGFKSINDIAAVCIGTAAAAAGILLALRYKSQTVLIFAVVCSFTTFFASIGGKAGFFAGLIYLVVMQAAAVLVSEYKDWSAVPFVGIVCNLITACVVMAAGSGLITVSIGAIVAEVYTVLSFAIYTIYSCVKGMEQGGALSADRSTALILSQALTILLTLLFMLIGTDRVSAGVALAVLAAIYLGITIIIAAFCKKGSGLVVCFENLLFSVVCIVIFTLILGRYAYMAFHAFAAALLIFGFLRGNKMFRVWGYVTLSVAEFYFLTVCLPNIDNDTFVWQFILNAAIWLAIMIIYAAKGRQGAALSWYSAAVMLNTGLLGVYLINSKLLGLLVRNGTILIPDRTLYGVIFCAALWMLLGFVAGKLKHMKTAGAAVSLCLYSIGLICLFAANIQNTVTNGGSILYIVVTVVINAISVLSALDMALRIKSLAPKFARAVALVVSAYALYTLTMVLGSNDWVAFTSCIISIVYLAAAAAWITFGFRRNNALLRRFGLALALFSSAKLFLFDFLEINAMGRTLMFIGFGITLLCISFAYGYFSKRLKDKR